MMSTKTIMMTSGTTKRPVSSFQLQLQQKLVTPSLSRHHHTFFASEVLRPQPKETVVETVRRNLAELRARRNDEHGLSRGVKRPIEPGPTVGANGAAHHQADANTASARLAICTGVPSVESGGQVRPPSRGQCAQMQLVAALPAPVRASGNRRCRLGWERDAVEPGGGVAGSPYERDSSRFVTIRHTTS